MKAAIRYEYCTPDLLEIAGVSLPKPGDDEILVKVKAATVNRTDCSLLTGKPWAIRLFIGLFKPVRPVTGTDFAGIVVGKGKHADQFEIGDHVYGFFDLGLSSHAEYLVVSTKKAILKKPENVTFEQAAASLEGGHYAFYFLKGLKLNAGDRILINGATGAVGNATLQFLKHFDVRITVTCEAEFAEVLKSQGAERAIDYQKEDFTAINEQFDFIFDAVGKSSFKKCRPLLKPKGIYLSSEPGKNCQNPLLTLLSPVMGGKKVKLLVPYSAKPSMKLINELILNGAFIPLIDRRYRLEDIEKAYHYVLSQQKKGNVVITFD